MKVETFSAKSPRTLSLLCGQHLKLIWTNLTFQFLTIYTNLEAIRSDLKVEIYPSSTAFYLLVYPVYKQRILYLLHRTAFGFWLQIILCLKNTWRSRWYNWKNFCVSCDLSPVSLRIKHSKGLPWENESILYHSIDSSLSTISVYSIKPVRKLRICDKKKIYLLINFGSLLKNFDFSGTQ